MQVPIVLLVLFLISAVFGIRTNTTSARNPVCGTPHSFKIEAGAPGLPISGSLQDRTYAIGFGDTIAFHGINVEGGYVLSWESSLSIDTVVMKGGRGGAVVYSYDPEVFSDNVPIYTTMNRNTYGAISYIMICWDYEVVISEPQIIATFDKTYVWEMQVAGPTDCLDMEAGETVLIPVTVTPSVSSYLHDWDLSGSFVVMNPDYLYVATIERVDVTIGSTTLQATCQSMTIPANHGSTTCQFSGHFVSENPGNYMVINVITSAISPVKSATSGANINWVLDAEIDKCTTIAVTGTLLSQTICDPSEVQPFVVPMILTQVGEHQIVTLTITGSASSLSVQLAVCIDVAAPAQGETWCMRTQGYWKNHPQLWAQYTGTVFNVSGETWYNAYFHESTTRDCYWKMAHQFVAAWLNQNVRSCTVPVEVSSALISASQILNNHTAPMQCTTYYLSIHDLLDQYNNGLLLELARQKTKSLHHK